MRRFRTTRAGDAPLPANQAGAAGGAASTSSAATSTGVTPDFTATMAAFARNRFVPVPPREREFTNYAPDAESFRTQGAGLATLLVETGLRAEHDVLEIGSGLGRIALPLTQFLTGQFFGIDINLSGVAWCHENITQLYPNFQFAVVNARNDNYRHPAEYGHDRLEHASLPIPSAAMFDYVYAYSLFTHLDWEETLYYLRVVAERLRPGGYFLATWFLLNATTRDAINAGTSMYRFDLDDDSPAVLVKDLEGTGPVAHWEDQLVAAASDLGLRVAEPPRYSSWSVNEAGQDTLVFTK